LRGAVIWTAADGVGVPNGVGLGVGVGAPLATVTLTAAVPICAPAELNAMAEMTCAPLSEVAEFQVKLYGGEDAR
jgi:hypothetical protein